MKMQLLTSFTIDKDFGNFYGSNHFKFSNGIFGAIYCIRVLVAKTETATKAPKHGISLKENCKPVFCVI